MYFVAISSTLDGEPARGRVSAIWLCGMTEQVIDKLKAIKDQISWRYAIANALKQRTSQKRAYINLNLVKRAIGCNSCCLSKVT